MAKISNERVTEVSAVVESGLWKAEVSKREGGDNVLVIGYGADEPEIYQGNEVTEFLSLVEAVGKFFKKPVK